MKKILFLIAFILILTGNVYAAILVYPTTYGPTSTVTNITLNSNNTAISQVLNGGLDNTNANTTQGYRFFQTVAVLPSPGSQGSVYFLTSDNSLNFDNGSAFAKSVSVISPTANQIPVYNGSQWIPTNTSVYMPSGAIIMWHGTIASIPTGWFLCDGTNGTPDLRNRMIVAANADVGGIAKTTIEGSATQTGGLFNHTNTLGEMVPHTHTISGLGNGSSANQSISFTATSSAQSTTTGSTGSGTAYSIMNPYYALALIMKS